MIDLRLIRNFEAVYRLGQFSRAGESLGMTQSALTKSIQTLETQWGVALFHRTTRQVSPTEAGRRLYPLSIQLLALGQSVRAQTLGGARQLKIITGPAVLETLITPALLVFRQTHPDIRISVETMRAEMAMDDLIQRRVQALVYHSDTLGALAQARDLKIQPVFSEPYMVAHRPGHPATGCKNLHDLLAYDWAVAGFDTLYEANLPGPLRQQLAAADFPRYRLLSQSACLDLAADSAILTAAPRSAVTPWLASGRLTTSPYPARFEFSVSVATPIKAQPDPALEAFIAALGVLA